MCTPTTLVHTPLDLWAAAHSYHSKALTGLMCMGSDMHAQKQSDKSRPKKAHLCILDWMESATSTYVLSSDTATPLANHSLSIKQVVMPVPGSWANSMPASQYASHFVVVVHCTIQYHGHSTWQGGHEQTLRARQGWMGKMNPARHAMVKFTRLDRDGTGYTSPCIMFLAHA